jgi:hypothetical protein
VAALLVGPDHDAADRPITVETMRGGTQTVVVALADIAREPEALKTVALGVTSRAAATRFTVQHRLA